MNRHNGSRLSEIAEKKAGQDLFRVFETLIQLGKLCVVEKADDRPEMVVVYMRLQNVMSSINIEPQKTGKSEYIHAQSDFENRNHSPVQ